MISRKGRLKKLKKSPYGSEEYDSALERQYMVELERDPAVKKWTKRHGIKIPYRIFGITRNYIPDFLVEYRDGSEEIHETKGLPFLLWVSTKLKGQSAEKFCKEKDWKYKLITKGSLAFYSKI